MQCAVTDKKPGREAGYTLLEIAIVIIALGVLVTAAVPIYNIYMKEKDAQTTRDRKSDIYYALIDYKKRMTKYPCPASLTAVNGDHNYGVEACPADSLAAGSCEDGLCMEEGPARITLENPDGTSTVTTTRVIRGAVPFRALGLSESKSYDGYGNRFYYVVTQRLTNATLFNENHGGIQIIDSAGNIVTNRTDGAGSAHFFLVSGGEHASGYYGRQGRMNGTCDTSTLEGENCDRTSRAVYRVSRQSAAGSNQDFDDFASYNALREPVLWRYVENGGKDVVDRSRDAVGIGRVPEDGEKVAVAGTAQSRNSASGRYYCMDNGNYCVDAYLFGKPSDKAPITGKKCPDDEYMVGFQGKLDPASGKTIGDIVCKKIVQIKCPDGGYLKGFDNKGVMICETPEKIMKSCPATKKPLCSVSRNLLQSVHGRVRTISFETTSQIWRCNDGVWELSSSFGSCVCTPRTLPPKEDTARCRNQGMTGSYVTQEVQTCAPFTVKVNVLQECTAQKSCPASSKTVCANTNASKRITLPAATSGTVFSSGNVGHSRIETFKCDNGLWVLNKANGVCLPPVGCKAQNVKVCGENKTLPEREDGGKYNVAAGVDRVVTYTCNNGTWKAGTATGVCTKQKCPPSAAMICGESVSLGEGQEYDVVNGLFDSQFRCTGAAWKKIRAESCGVEKTCRWKLTNPGSSTRSFRGSEPAPNDVCDSSQENATQVCINVAGTKYRENGCRCACTVKE